MPRGKPSGDQGSDPRTNKMEAVRQAMEALGYDAQPQAIQTHIKDNYGVDIGTNMISSYKSSLRKKAGLKGRRKKRGRPKKSETVAAAPAAPSFHDAVPWKDLRTIKDIAGRIGKKGLRELVDLLD
jgi:hypothetical protein